VAKQYYRRPETFEKFIGGLVSGWATNQELARSCHTKSLRW